MAQRYAQIYTETNVVVNVIMLDSASQWTDPQFYVIQSDTLNISDIYNASEDIRRCALVDGDNTVADIQNLLYSDIVAWDASTYYLVQTDDANIGDVYDVEAQTFYTP